MSTLNVLEPKGLSSAEAFRRLRILIWDHRNVFKTRLAVSRMVNRQFPDPLWFINVALCIVSLSVSQFLGGDQLRSIGSIAILIGLMLLLAYASFVEWKRSDEFVAHANSKTDHILSELEFYTNDNLKFIGNSTVPDCLRSDVQLVIRDGLWIQLPVLLLVHGDIVLLRPGQPINFYCTVHHPQADDRRIEPGSVYTLLKDHQPGTDLKSTQQDQFDHPVEALVTEAPILEFMTPQDHTIHGRSSSSSPALTLFIQISGYVVNVIWISLGLLVLVAVVFHNTQQALWLTGPLASSWLLLVSAKFIFYSSGIASWLLWRISVALVCTRFHGLQHKLKDAQFVTSDYHSDRSLNRRSVESVLSGRRARNSSHSVNFVYLTSRAKQTWSELAKLCRSNLDNSVLILGAVSSVCCVHRDGLLSRPRLFPEKIFFFRKRHHHHQQQQHEDMGKNHPLADTPNATIYSRSGRPKLQTNPFSSSVMDPTSSFSPSKMPDPFTDWRHEHVASISSDLDDRPDLIHFGDHRPRPTLPVTSTVVPVNLNLRTDAQWPCLPHFEKPKWMHYLASLKPIGLALLLNNAHELYKPRRRFADHLVARAHHPDSLEQQEERLQNPLLMCHCSLARRIGFQAGATRSFKCYGSVGAYSLTSPLLSQNSRFLQSPTEIQSIHSNAPVSLPFQSEPFSSNRFAEDSFVVANAFSAIFTCSSPSGGYQLMTQATGDMLAGLCSDVWDGRDVSPLLQTERCALLDFYNRNASAAYCVGFAYSPLLDRLPSLLRNRSFTTHDDLAYANEDPVLIRFPKLEESIWAEETYSTAIDRRSQLTRSRPASARRTEAIRPFIHTTVNNNLSGFHAPEWQQQQQQQHGEYQLLSCSVPCSDINVAEFAPTTVFNLSGTVKRLDAIVQPSQSSLKIRKCTDGFTRSSSSEFLSVYNKERRGEDAVDGARRSFYCVDPPPVLREQTAGDVMNGSQSSSSFSPLSSESKEWQNLLGNQIFLGLISMQYQVLSDVVDTIKLLDQACIRFVYFSRENELRSRVFAERLGLECGWNCHISLANPTTNVPSPPLFQHQHSASVEMYRNDNQSNEGVDLPAERERVQISLDSVSSSGNHRVLTHPHSSLGMRRFISLPTLYTKCEQPSSSNQLASPQCYSRQAWNISQFDRLRTSGLHSLPAPCALNPLASDPTPRREIFGGVGDGTEVVSMDANQISSHATHSSSSSTASSSSSTSCAQHSQRGESRCCSGPRLSYYVTDNKSRLPCGIANIRPHLQNVDNVPLQVPLFTDCSTGTTKEMIQIMQEYGETVCVVGSCYSIDSLRLMHCGDVAIAIQPELPEPCEAFAVHWPDEKCPDVYKSHHTDDKSVPSLTHATCATQSHDYLLSDAQPSGEARSDIGWSGFSKFKNQKPTSSSVHVHALHLTARLVCSLSPAIINFERPGFRVYELITEAHASVNNLYLVLAVYWLAPLSFALVQFILLCIGLPTMPYTLITDSANMSSLARPVTVVWLPSEPFRTNLIPITDAALRAATPLVSKLGTNLYLCMQRHFVVHSTWLGPDFGSGQLLWLVFGVIPALSLSTIDRRVERGQPLSEPPVKRGKWLSKKKCIRTTLITMARFVPSVIVCVLCLVGHMHWAPGFNSCAHFIQSVLNSTQTEDRLNILSRTASSNLSQVQIDSFHCLGFPDLCFVRLSLLVRLIKDLLFLQLINYLVIISLTYANFGQSVLRFRFSTNPSWCISAALIVTVQTVWFFLHCFEWNDALQVRAFTVLNPIVLASGFLWCPVLLLLNETIAWKERRLIHMEHRLARLYFGTKLGMYSPV